ncbi:MAG: hypothetical protein L0Z50_17045 [Verrucomicrobiales bacterium]|nr:hypothetical protein [Verrucomicrobiales bacterium]
MQTRPPGRSLTLAIAFLLAFAAADGQAQPVRINFEGLSGMSYVSGTPVPASARLSNQLDTTYGAIFSSDGAAPYVAVVTLGAGHATSGTNGIAPVTNDGVSYRTPLRVTFVLPYAPSVPAVTDFVSIRGDLQATGQAPVTLRAFSIDGALLGSVSRVDSQPVILSVTNAGIHSILVSELDTVAYDDLRFSLPTPPTPAHPVEVGIALACVQVSWSSRINQQYQVQYSSALTSNSWVNLGMPVAGNGTTNTLIDDVLGQARRFYRVVEVP